MVQKEKSAKEGQMQVGVVTLEPSLSEIIRKPSGENKKYEVYLEKPGAEKRMIGHIVFKYKQAGELENEEVRKAVGKHLDGNAWVADIVAFCPLDHVSPDEEKRFKRAGGFASVGLEVLNQLLKEFDAKKAAGACCETKETGLQALLEMKGFERISGNLYFKKFGSEELSLKEGVETEAGFVKLKAEAYGPIGDIGRLYSVVLKPSPSSKEEILGSVTAPFEKLEMIDDDVELYTAFIKEGLNENSKIAELFTVFPLGIRRVEDAPESLKPRLHKGIGTETLREVLKDLEFHGVAGVYVSDPEEPLAKLLKERFGFKKVDEVDGITYFFKKL